METETHIDGDTIKGPRADGYPFLAENVDPAYIKAFAAAPAMLAALKRAESALANEIGDNPDIGSLNALQSVVAAIDSAEGRPHA